MHPKVNARPYWAYSRPIMPMYEQSACRRVLVGQLGHRECSDVTAPDLLSLIVKLALLAQLFCILATSVPCEKGLLSSAAYVNKERSSLSGENVTIKHFNVCLTL